MAWMELKSELDGQDIHGQSVGQTKPSGSY